MTAVRRILAALPRTRRLTAVVVALAVAGTSTPGHAQELDPTDVEREVEALAEQEKYREMAERIDAALKQIPEAFETRVRRNLLVSKAINGYRLAFEQAPDACELADAGVSLADEYLRALLSVYGAEAENSDEYVGISALRQELDIAATKRDCQEATAPGSPPEESAPPPREVEPESAAAPSPFRRAPPDWALRILPGYSMSPWRGEHGGIFNSAHLGIAFHASQRFGARQRGYIGGGPRLHVVVPIEWPYPIVGLEGNVLVGGGSQRLVGLFSLRMGGGGLMDAPRPLMWLVGGPAILGKINRRWSMGGHIEAGVLGAPLPDSILANFATEVGFDFAWHFGRGRRHGI